MVSLDPEETVAGMIQAVLDIRRATAWLADQPEIDGGALGITGISLGGIVSALAASAEPRIGKACLVLAGGDIERVAWQSQALAPVRRHWLARGLTEEMVQAQLRRVDPVTYADRLKGRRILMINARHDEVVPPECTESLWNAVGQPEIVWWNAGHFTAAFFLPEGLNRICRFFQPSRGT
jgi:cephalosporin-C deacetylase-like acetyl esterase